MQRTSIICFLSLLAVLGSCGKKCEPFDMMPEFDQLQNVPDILDIDLDCIDNTSLPRTQVIYSDSIYENMLSPFIEQALFCDLDSLPVIDFDTQMLIWSITTHVIVDKVIIRQGNTVKHIVKVKESNFATGQFRMNAVSLPKLSETDTVIFETVTYGCD